MSWVKGSQKNRSASPYLKKEKADKIERQAKKRINGEVLEDLRKGRLALPAPTQERFSNRANMLLESNRLREALEAYNECLKLDPQDMNAMYNRGLIKGILKDKEGALSDLGIVLLQRGVLDPTFFTGRSRENRSLIKVKAIIQSANDQTVVSKAQAELEEINKNLQNTLQYAMKILENPPFSNSEDATKILTEAATIAEQKIKEKFPDLPPGMPIAPSTQSEKTTHKLDKGTNEKGSKHVKAQVRFRNRKKNSEKPPGPIKPKLDFVVRRIELQIQKLDLSSDTFDQRDKAISARMADAYSKNDTARANIFSNELVELRKISKWIINTKLALEQITLRLRTVKELGDVVSTLGPAVGVLRSVRGELTSVFPGTESELGEIGNMLSGIAIEAGPSSGMKLNFDQANEDALKILTGVATIAEQKIKEKFPDLPPGNPIAPSTQSEKTTHKLDKGSEEIEKPEPSKNTTQEPVALVTSTQQQSTSLSDPQSSLPEPVILGATAPQNVQRGEKFTARFVSYIKEMETTVRLILMNLSARSKTHLGLKKVNWAVGTEVEIKLYGDYVKIDRPTQRFVWDGEYNLIDFDAEVLQNAPNEITILKFDVLINEFVVAMLRLDLSINEKSSSKELVTVNAESARTAFASYASEDKLRVLDRVDAVKISAGLDVFTDCLSLHPGENWKKRIEHEIDQRELFLLFWSKNAQHSKYVTWEWKTALLNKKKNAMQIHPLQPIFDAPPPKELNDIHFGSVGMLARKAYEESEKIEGKKRNFAFTKAH
jgi:division protein CdvB (Snf7/Vps24/ESCRT-III family)